ncbi:MAG: ATP-binding cassette domain-containing protein [bacterium]|nr:ATP-binding cassette domain-containing protein [bacterium]MDY4979521.1 ATP-binding cassette domain-containing protein [Candidatus Onthovivens sp.]
MEDKNYIIDLKNVSKIFDGVTVVDNFNLYVKKGEFITFLGPSGCGKSTTLRMIAGFEFPSKGEIMLKGKDITNLPPNKRPINMVFQRYALFPHLDVYENVAFGLRLKKIPVELKDKEGKTVYKVNKEKVNLVKEDIRVTKKNKNLTNEEKEAKLAKLKEKLEGLLNTPEIAYKYKKLTAKEIDSKVARALKIVDLDSLEDRDITTLSGGQQQRVAIARAIVNEPEILLLDEPLGALDLKMRKDMQIELKEMHNKLGITFIYVTHDQEEALTMSDTIVVMKDGEIQQIGTPKMIYDEPKNAFVADFIGESNIYNATMVGKLKVRLLNTVFDCLDDFPLNEKVDVVIRPEDIKIVEANKGNLNGVIYSRIFKGMNYEYTIMINKNELLVKDTKEYPLNMEVGLNIEPDSIHIMKKDFVTNIYTDAYIDKDLHVVIDDKPFDCDLTQLIPNSVLDEDGLLFVKETNKHYDVKDATVVAEVDINNVELVDDINSDEAQAVGEIVDIVYKGDHYQLIVRTDDEEDFVCITPYTYNLNDKIGIRIDKKNIRLRLKKEMGEYEI